LLTLLILILLWLFESRIIKRSLLKGGHVEESDLSD